MLVANSFDLWQKDTFFSAAEEVQESADIMESAYRTWSRERKDRLTTNNFDEYSRELQTALGTAKWQLEEFEKAVQLSYGYRGDDGAIARHRQFIHAIENQIFRVEVALREFFSEDGKQPLQWVNLDEEERDDLAAFLSGTSQESAKAECLELMPAKRSVREIHSKPQKEDTSFSAACSLDTSKSNNSKSTEDAITMNRNLQHVIELGAGEISPAIDDKVHQADRIKGARRTWSSPSLGALRIVIADENDQSNPLMPCVEATPKEKGSKSIFWKQKCMDFPQARGGVNMFNQLFGRVWFQRHLHSPRHLQRGCSVKVTLALVLTIFLIAPFLLYST